jgi:hypothetical protein
VIEFQRPNSSQASEVELRTSDLDDPTRGKQILPQLDKPRCRNEELSLIERRFNREVRVKAGSDRRGAGTRVADGKATFQAFITEVVIDARIQGEGIPSKLPLLERNPESYGRLGPAFNRPWHGSQITMNGIRAV